MMSLAIVVYCFATFAPPLAIKGFLAYIETDGRDATISPWIWVALMFLGPMVTSLSLQWYLYYAAAAFFRVEAMLVQLILEHSLRIRLKSDSDGAVSEPNGGSGKGDGETSSESQGGTDADSVMDVSSQTEGSVSKGKSKASTSSADDHDGDEEKGTKKDNLIGKINTLITVDLGNIVDAKDWLTLGSWFSCPTRQTFNIDALPTCSSASSPTGCDCARFPIPSLGMECHSRTFEHCRSYAHSWLPCKC